MKRSVRQLIHTFSLLALFPVGILLHAVPPTQDRTDCGTLRQEGRTLYRQAQYPEALQKFQTALNCYRKVGNRAGEGTTLNNIGLVYHNAHV